jgi:hypothetical protein
MRYFIFICLLIGAGCSGPKIQSPRIKFEEVKIDFGDIPSEFDAVHIFRFKNIGSDTLLIEKVRAP